MNQILRVGDLNQLFESIQKDIDELIETKNKIPKGRDYSDKILLSIDEEIEKLKKRKKILLDVEIKLPENLIEALNPKLNQSSNPSNLIEIEKNNFQNQNSIIPKKERTPNRY